MVQYLVALVPTFLVLAFFCLGPFNWSRRHTWTRAVTCAFVAAVALRYMFWRLTETVLPYPNNGASFYWVWILFVVEILACVEVILFLVLMSRYVDRSAEADRLARGFFARDKRELPTVDVFIPTYNEPLDVLERTIIGARSLDYPPDKLTLFQRIMFLPASWLVQYLVRFMILLVPIVYLWFGLLPLYFTDIADYVSHQVPLLAAYFLLMLWITPTRYLPVISSAVGTFATFRMLPTVVSSLVRPFGKPFRVTPKGSGNESNQFDRYSFAWIASIIMITVLGLLVNIVPETAHVQGQFSPVAAWWSGINIVVLLIASLICFEKPRRLFHAFKLDEPAIVDDVPGQIVSLALDKAVVAVPTMSRFQSKSVVLKLPGFAPFKSELRLVTQRRRSISRGGDKQSYYLHLYFELIGSARDSMIVKLYTGQYSQDIRDIDKVAVSLNLLLRSFGRTRTL